MANSDTHISVEPLINLGSEAVGSKKALKVQFTDDLGYALISESLTWETRYDYDTRTDGQPVYSGYAQPGAATSDAVWLLHKFTYSSIAGTDFVTRRQVATDCAWDDRTTSF